MLTQDDINHVVHVIQVLYSPEATLSAADQQALNHQLLEAQRTDAAWALIGPLLGHEDGNVRFFGAHTASVKIHRDWESLPADQHEPLLASILDWTGRLAASATSGGSNGIVVRKLFVAVAGLAIRLSSADAFGQPLSTMLDLLSRAGGESTRPLALEFAKILPEEVARSGLLGPRKRALADVLRREEPVVCARVGESVGRWQTGARGDVHEAELVEGLNCVEAWIAAGALSADSLTTFIPALIGLLDAPDGHSEVFAASASVLCEILTASVLKDGRGSKVLTEPVLAWCAGPVCQTLANACFNTGDVEEPHESLVKLLASLGEHSADYLALSLAETNVQAYLGLILGFAGLEGYFGADEEVSDLVVPFWSDFQEALTASPHIETADAEPPSPEWQVAQSVFFELVRRLLRKVTLPADEGASWLADQRERFKSYRFELGDCLVTAFYVLRRPLLGFLHGQLVDRLVGPSNAGQPVAWHEVEAVLHALRCVREAIPVDEAEVLPFVFSSEVLGRLPSQGGGRVRLTAVSLVGDYASWLHMHPAFVPGAVELLVPALSETTLCVEAAKSLKRVCDLCRKSLTGHVGPLAGLYDQVAERIEPEEKAKVLEAVVSVVQALPPAEAVAPVLSITTPIVEKLSEALNGAAQLPEEARALAIQQLRSLTAIAKGLAPSDDFEAELAAADGEGEDGSPSAAQLALDQARADQRIVHLRQRILDAITGVAHGWGTDLETAAELSDFLKAMSASMTNPTLLSIDSESLVQLIASAAAHHINGVWLSLAETFVNRLAPSGLLAKRRTPAEHAATVATVREATAVLVSAGAGALAAGADAMHAAPDIVEGLFKFASAVAVRFPAALLAPPSEALGLLLGLAVEGLRLPDRYSLQAVTGFMTSLLRGSRSPIDLTAALEPGLRAHGRAMVVRIIAGAEGHSPRSVVPNLAELLSALVTRLTEESTIWLAEALSIQNHPESKATPQAREKLRAAVLGSRSTKRVRDGLNEFALVARGLEGSAYAGVAPP